jgi:hypothetical protein
VAVTVNVPGVLPAVNKPEELIVPPVADHVTAVFVACNTVAVNCCELPSIREGEVVDTVTTTGYTVAGNVAVNPLTGSGLQVNEVTTRALVADIEQLIACCPIDIADSSSSARGSRSFLIIFISPKRVELFFVC